MRHLKGPNGKEVLARTEALEWAARRMMEFRTAVLLVNWMQEEGMIDDTLSPVGVAKKFTSGPPSNSRRVFDKAARAAMDGYMKVAFKGLETGRVGGASAGARRKPVR